MKLTLRKKIIFSVAVIVIFSIFMEMGTFAFMTAMDLKNGESFKGALDRRIKELKIPWEEKVLLGYFDPVMQTRHIPNGKYGVLGVNEHGFIHNGHADPILNSFPEKPEGVYRILLFGGSSTGGTGVDKNSLTISAQLEKILNERKAEVPALKSKTFQVLNFGAGGGYSGAEQIKFQSYASHFEPDLVISLDGFNDAWNVVLEHHRVGIDHPIINWGDISYKHFELMNGLRPHLTRTPPPVFTYTFTFLFRYAGKFEKRKIMKRRQDLYAGLPNYNHAEYLLEKYPHLENVIYRNLDAFASHAAFNDTVYIGYLQPFSSVEKELTKEEKGRIDHFFISYAGGYGSGFTEENYNNSMIPTFEKFSEIYLNLDKKYNRIPNVRFFDIRSLFKDEKETTYFDVIHYTERGNNLLAERYYKDIVKILSTRQGIS